MRGARGPTRPSPGREAGARRKAQMHSPRGRAVRARRSELTELDAVWTAKRGRWANTWRLRYLVLTPEGLVATFPDDGKRTRAVEVCALGDLRDRLAGSVFRKWEERLGGVPAPRGLRRRVADLLTAPARGLRRLFRPAHQHQLTDTDALEGDVAAPAA